MILAKEVAPFYSLRKGIALQSGETTPSLRMLYPTRWTVRHTSFVNIVKNYQILQTALEEMQQGRDDYAAKANGLLARVEKFDTFFCFETFVFSFLFC